jgi:hypothetical protein
MQLPSWLARPDSGSSELVATPYRALFLINTLSDDRYKEPCCLPVVIAAYFLYSSSINPTVTIFHRPHRPLHAVSPEYVALRVGVNTTLFTVDSVGVLALRSSIRLNTCCATRRVVCMAIGGCVGCSVRTYAIN